MHLLREIYSAELLVLLIIYMGYDIKYKCIIFFTI